jgi:ankyrin repeat protein
LNEFGERATVLQVAAYSSNIELVKLLVNHGAALDKPAYSLRGFTVMQGAAMSGQMAMVKFVRGLGATLNAKPAAIQGVTTLEAQCDHRMNTTRMNQVNIWGKRYMTPT